MHEFSMVSNIARIVLNKAEELKPKQIVSVNLEIGEFTFLNPEQIRFWLKELFKETVVSSTKVFIKSVKPKMKCEECGYEGRIKIKNNPTYHTYFPVFSCPKCESSRIEIKRGKECLIKSIKIMG